MENLINTTLVKKQRVFSKTSTFWDADLNQLDLVRDKYFVIARIAERGRDEEIDFILNYFSKDDLLFAINNSPETTPRTKNYFKVILA